MIDKRIPSPEPVLSPSAGSLEVTEEQIVVTVRVSTARKLISFVSKRLLTLRSIITFGISFLALRTAL